MNMYTRYEHSGARAPERYDFTQSGWSDLADAADVPEAPSAWTLEDFADILPDAGAWQ